MSGVFHSAQEEQPGVISTRLPSWNDDFKLVDGSEVHTRWTV